MKEKKVILIAIAIPTVALILALLFIFVKRNNVQAVYVLPVDNYIEHPLNYAGNSYSFSASIISQLAYSDTKGRILLVKLQTTNHQLPIFVPPVIKGFNPQVNQIYAFFVNIDSEGKLVLTDFKKI